MLRMTYVGKSKFGDMMFELERRYKREDGTWGRRWIGVGKLDFINRIFKSL